MLFCYSILYFNKKCILEHRLLASSKYRSKIDKISESLLAHCGPVQIITSTGRLVFTHTVVGPCVGPMNRADRLCE